MNSALYVYYSKSCTLFLQCHHDCCAYVCRFVGWITNFIRQRHQAAASCAHAYSRLTFVRRMPPHIRARLQKRQNNHHMNTTMRGFIAPYAPFTGRGTGQLFVKKRNWRNSRPITEVDRDRVKR